MIRLKDLPVTFVTGQALKAGVRPRTLYAWRDDGDVVELSRGVSVEPMPCRPVTPISWRWRPGFRLPWPRTDSGRSSALAGPNRETSGIYCPASVPRVSSARPGEVLEPARVLHCLGPVRAAMDVLAAS